MSAENQQITSLLEQWAGGEERAFDQLVDLVYPILRKMASARLSGSERVQLQTTELVHESYLKLVEQTRTNWQNRGHFYAIAARVMRRVLVDQARGQGRIKRGGNAVEVTFDENLGLQLPHDSDWIHLDQCLSQLEDADPTASQLVELRVFAGLGIDETAKFLGIGRTTAVRKWRLSKAWLQEHWLPHVG